MDLIILVVIGGIAGFIAEKVTRSRHGLLTNIIVGIVGSFIGSYIARILNLNFVGGFVDKLVVATLGAILLVFLFKQLKR